MILLCFVEVFLSDKDIDFDVCHITLLDLARQNDMAIPMLGGDDLDQSVKDHLALYLVCTDIYL